MKSRVTICLTILSLIAASCGGSASTGDAADAEPFELTADQQPVFRSGGSATGSVELQGTTVDYVTVTPPGFVQGISAPVFLAFPPGGQDLDITENVTEFVYQTQALQRGWVVVSPAVPSGRWSDDDNVELIPDMIRWIEAWVTVEGGRPHLGGMSNGGLSAFTIATELPGDFASLVVYPGTADDDAREGLSALADIPVRMWVGANDPGWSEPMEAVAESLRALGADVELQVIPGEGHVLQSTSDGVAIFNELDAAR